MEESKFLEAQNLKNQIHYLEKIIEDNKRQYVKIGVIWEESKSEITVSTMSIHNYTETRVNPFPKDIQNKVIQLMNDELDKLKEEFKNL